MPSFQKDAPSMFHSPQCESAARSAARALASLFLLSSIASEAHAVQGVKVPIEGSEFYYLRYADDLISVNDRCPVRKTRMGERMPPVLVNGKAIGFC
jgi:hypothetical protein